MEIAKMSAAQLTKAMEKASTESSKITQMMIDAGRGYEYPNEMMKKSDPLSLKYQKSASLLQDLYAEKNRRMTYQGNMRPIKYQGNPTMATKKFSPAQIAAQKLFAERARAGTLGQRKKRKPNPEAIPYAKADVEKFYLGGKMYAEIVKKSNNSYDYVVYQMYSTGVPGEKPREQFFDSKNYKTKAGAMRGLEKYVQRLGYKINPDKSKPRAYVKRASQATGAPPSKRLLTRRKKALSAPAGYFPNPKVKKPFGREAPQKYYEVSKMEDGVDTKFYPIGHFFTFLEAEKYSRYLAKQHGNWSIRVRDKRAM